MSQELLNKNTGEITMEAGQTSLIVRAQLDSQISTAKAWPRTIAASVEYAEQMATLDEETAQSCFYCLLRKDKDGAKKEIRGPSIRLAEIMANAWTNIHCETRIVENDGRSITAEGMAWDLQANVKISMQNKVSIWFGEKQGKGGYQANADMQTVLSNAASAKALRNAIFKVIPKALVDRVMRRAMEFSVGDQKTINTKVRELVDKLVKQGVDLEKMLGYFGYESIGQITPDDFKSLIGVGTAIKEGHIKPEDVFGVEAEGESSLSAASKISNLIHAKKSEREASQVQVADQPLTDDEVPY